jgi:type II secretory pathway pseudopilin PulG
MAKSSPPSVEHAFTLIKLLVVIAGIGILLGIAVPALNSAYERVKVTKDMSNLRQIGLGVQLYLNDKDGVLPVINAAQGIGTNASPVICPKYIATKKVFQSPFDKRGDSEGMMRRLATASTKTYTI